ncbi:MAG: ribonuclease HII [Deltaproteobacteria bacterium]|nr:ribonuclease HII [Deltaproteobacteria bacterium]
MLTDKRYSHIAGIDEVGRGPLAGPVVACAMVIPDRFRCTLVKDSKLLTPDARIKAYQYLRRYAVSFGIGVVDEQTIDRINIRNATMRAMEQALSMLGHTVEIVLIDGNMEINTDLPQKTIIDGDRLHLSIASASIVAKVYRDFIMERYDALYPEYGFARHKGYGTREHMSALTKYGPCPIHRRSFLKKLFSGQLDLPMGT